MKKIKYLLLALVLLPISLCFTACGKNPPPELNMTKAEIETLVNDAVAKLDQVRSVKVYIEVDGSKLSIIHEASGYAKEEDSSIRSETWAVFGEKYKVVNTTKSSEEKQYIEQNIVAESFMPQEAAESFVGSLWSVEGVQKLALNAKYKDEGRILVSYVAYIEGEKPVEVELEIMKDSKTLIKSTVKGEDNESSIEISEKSNAFEIPSLPTPPNGEWVTIYSEDEARELITEGYNNILQAKSWKFTRQDRIEDSDGYLLDACVDYILLEDALVYRKDSRDYVEENSLDEIREYLGIIGETDKAVVEDNNQLKRYFEGDIIPTVDWAEEKAKYIEMFCFVFIEEDLSSDVSEINMNYANISAEGKNGIINITYNIESEDVIGMEVNITINEETGLINIELVGVGELEDMIYIVGEFLQESNAYEVPELPTPPNGEWEPMENLNH